MLSEHAAYNSSFSAQNKEDIGTVKQQHIKGFLHKGLSLCSLDHSPTQHKRHFPHSTTTRSCAMSTVPAALSSVQEALGDSSDRARGFRPGKLGDPTHTGPDTSKCLCHVSPLCQAAISPKPSVVSALPTL